MKSRIARISLALFLLISSYAVAAAAETGPMVVSLDGNDWLVATDPNNVGRDQRWWEESRPDARTVRVPGIFQEAFPGYHGVAWYWHDFVFPQNPHQDGRYLLRFWMVDYLADVWVNGVHVGSHEGGEGMFVLDVTQAAKPGASNRIAVRVLNPTFAPIDGIALSQTPRRNKSYPYSPGSDYNYGGITDSAELLVVPPVRIENLCVRPDWKAGAIQVVVKVRNALDEPAKGRLILSVAPAASGETTDEVIVDRSIAPGDTSVESGLEVLSPHLWDLNDPFLYRVTVRLDTDGSDSFDEQSTTCGFRDFRFSNGYFRLNGRRIFLRSAHFGGDSPVGVRVPIDPDLVRRDLLDMKVMGFNMLRPIASLPRRYQVDLCDEIGLMLYEECYAGWCLGDSPKMAERFDNGITDMIMRDRNHPSVVIWGMLNENPPNAVFFHAVAALPLVRSLDDTRLVMLNGARSDGFIQNSGEVTPEAWEPKGCWVPHISFNQTNHPMTYDGTTWAPGQLALHPGNSREYSVIRWTAPAAGDYSVTARFTGIAAAHSTSDIHVYRNGTPIFDGLLNLKGHGNTADFTRTFSLEKGGTLDVIVGPGNESPFSDTTALVLTIKSADGKTYDAASNFNLKNNPNDPWAYGFLAPAPKPDPATFKLYDEANTGRVRCIGSLSNPGSLEWEDVLGDKHPYQATPHTASIIHTLRTIDGDGRPLWLSEYGIGSAVNLSRVLRHFEQLGKESSEDARAYQHFLDMFMTDWNRWKLSDAFPNPDDYFKQCIATMAGQRLLGTSAIRANPNVVGHSLTALHDTALTGEGLITTFRELKPGAVDAMFEAWYPLKWCLFVEPVQVYRGKPARFEAVLANEDAMKPGRYPVRFQIVGPDQTRVLDKVIEVTIPDPHSNPEPPFALNMFAETLPVDGPSGKYRFMATFEKGGAATGGETEFYVADPAEMPKVDTEVVLWGQDAQLASWLEAENIKCRPFTEAQTAREVILVGNKAGADTAAWQSLARHIASGSTAIALSPEVFAKDNKSTAWLPLAHKGRVTELPSGLYHKDDWTKNHPIFDGLPSGGIMDFTFYREIIPPIAYAGLDAPLEAVAGGIGTSAGYSSGLYVGVYRIGAGRLILNTLRIRENLGRDPVAERLVRNLLRYAAQDTAQPMASLPPDFDSQLNSMGY
ncbi:MAG: glycoside hydrolase family 2 [Candidatus Omnitrophica bacterium]|nr:glycoside hydrolase family 2 [Candidatus Omnitrophota bacterium]